MEVIKVGERQHSVKLGDKILVSEQLLQEIKIKDQGVIEGVYKIPNADQIFALIC